MHPPSTFTTERLTLRAPVPDDAGALFASYTQDAEVTRYLVWRPHRAISETQAFLEYCTQAWQHGSEYTYVIVERASSQLLGMISMRVADFDVTLGYVLARSAWGCGIMPEAAAAVTEWALAQPAIYRVAAVCDCDNQASARVLEKIGMQREGRLRRAVLHPNVSEQPRDCWLYAKVK